MCVGRFCYPSLPSMSKAPIVDPRRTQEVLERVGPERCIVASDVGMLLDPTAVEALRLMVRLLLVLGLAPDQIDLMLKQNPARLIGLTAESGGTLHEHEHPLSCSAATPPTSSPRA